MHVFGLEFNLANVWALPLIIGTAAEFGLNIFVRFRRGASTGGPTLGAEHGDGRRPQRAHDHGGVRQPDGGASPRASSASGLLLTVGMIASLAASLVVLPVLLRRIAGPAAPAALPARTDVSPGGAPAS